MLIDEVIDCIAVLAEQKKTLTYLQGSFYIGFRCCPPLIGTWEMYGLDWEPDKGSSKLDTRCGYALRPSQEKTEELNKYIYDHSYNPPKLSPAQIDRITSDYPFQLPREFYKLYQRANGIFPIGIGDKDWQSFDNYFVLDFTLWSEALLPVQDAMYMYRENDSRMFPIISFENRERWAVMGSDEQQDISPVYSVSDGCQPDVIYSSLAEMLSTCLEEYSK